MIPKTLFQANLLCLLVLTACSQPADEVEITETTTRSETRPVPRVNTPDDERFQLARPQGAPMAPAPGAVPTTAGADAATEPPDAATATDQTVLFEYTVPEGWTELPATQFRNPNFRMGSNGDIECYVTVLPGEGGGLLVNANRWRGQMGQQPYSEDEFAQLPRANILNRPSVIVDFTGDYMAMGASEPQAGYRLVGALLQVPRAAIFIKMVGPDEAVEAQKDKFAMFAQSLRLKGMPDTQQTAAAPSPQPGDEQTPPASPQDVPQAPGGDTLSWQAPEGWEEVDSGSPMRTVTLRFGPDGAGECYVVSLPGMAGGRLDNFNRWLAQVGEPPLEESELELQPKVELFDEQVPMLIAKGTYTGMGGESRPNHVLMGAVAELEGQTLFVKLVAPENVANDHWDNFSEFCASLARD